MGEESSLILIYLLAKILFLYIVFPNLPELGDKPLAHIAHFGRCWYGTIESSLKIDWYRPQFVALLLSSCVTLGK